MECSCASGCGDYFNERKAEKSLKRYRTKGLEADARTMLHWAASGGLVGATVLEVGGGVGALAAELLKRGAARAENVEVVSAWEPFARQLASSEGLGDRLQFRVADVLAAPDAAALADVVAMQRVVCCSAEGIRLAGIAAGLARRVLVLSYPRDAFWTRSFIAAHNGVFRLLGRRFRALVHPPAAILRAAEERGLKLEHRTRGPVWEVVSLRR